MGTEINKENSKTHETNVTADEDKTSFTITEQCLENLETTLSSNHLQQLKPLLNTRIHGKTAFLQRLKDIIGNETDELVDLIIESATDTDINGEDIYGYDVPTKFKIATGDLFDEVSGFFDKGCSGIVLTPLCDLLSQKKSKLVKLAMALPFKTYLKENFIPEKLKNDAKFKKRIDEKFGGDPVKWGTAYLDDPNERDETKTIQLVKELKRILENVNPIKPSYYYLPGKEDKTNGFLIDFSHISSIPRRILDTLTPTLRLKSPWREQLLSRYISFSMRVGTSDYSEQSIRQTIQELFPELPEGDITKKMNSK